MEPPSIASTKDLLIAVTIPHVSFRVRNALQQPSPKTYRDYSHRRFSFIVCP